MGFLATKIGYILVIFAVGVTGGFTALRMAGGAGSGSVRLSLGNAFAAGVFLGAGLLHMLPDSNDLLSQTYPHTDYPFAALLAGAAAIGVLLTDQIGKAIGKSDGSRSLILFIVLSIHSLIAGTSLGLEGGVLASLTIFFAIIAHKGAAGFALGTALSGDDATRARRTIVLFSITTPIGVGLGTLLSVMLQGRDAMLAEGLFDGLAAGTFLYIALVDIVGDAFGARQYSVPKFILLGAGFALMAAIAIWT